MTLLGGRVTRIGDASLVAVMESLHPLIPADNAGSKHGLGAYYLRLPWLLHALGHSQHEHATTLTVEDASGREHTVVVQSRPRNETVDGREAAVIETEMTVPMDVTLDLETLVDGREIDVLQTVIMRHVALTGSRYVEGLMRDWAALQRRIVKVMPRDYKRVLRAEAEAKRKGRVPEFSELVGAANG